MYLLLETNLSYLCDKLTRLFDDLFNHNRIIVYYCILKTWCHNFCVQMSHGIHKKCHFSGDTTLYSLGQLTFPLRFNKQWTVHFTFTGALCFIPHARIVLSLERNIILWFLHDKSVIFLHTVPIFLAGNCSIRLFIFYIFQMSIFFYYKFLRQNLKTIT